MSQPITSVAISRLVADPTVWPRQSWDQERIALFADLYAADGPTALPPILAVPLDERYLVADGWTRARAALLAKFTEIPAKVIVAPNDVDPAEFAYRLALETAVASARPLTRSERNAAVVRLLASGPSLSDRQIAKLAGVAHTTVGRIRAGKKAPAKTEPGAQYYASVTSQEQATRLFRGIEKVWEARGLGVMDALVGDRTSARFADVLLDSFGDGALERAIRYRTWIDGAIGILRGGSRTLQDGSGS